MDKATNQAQPTTNKWNETAPFIAELVAGKHKPVSADDNDGKDEDKVCEHSGHGLYFR
jgi:hypothetical protein